MRLTAHSPLRNAHQYRRVLSNCIDTTWAKGYETVLFWYPFGTTMLRISKMTDYGIVLMAHFARQSEGMLLSSKSVAAQTSLTAPTVSKLLKTLTREGLLDSGRGAQGGLQTQSSCLRD